MNGKHVQSKLKNHNKILKILVAFLLLSLMVPKMSFAEEPTVQPNDNAIEEVSNEVAVPLTEAPSNEVIITGKVTDEAQNPISDADVFAEKNGAIIGQSFLPTGDDGKYSLSLTDVQQGEQLELCANIADTDHSYGEDVVGYSIGDGECNFILKGSSSVQLRCPSSQSSRHDKYVFETFIDNIKYSSIDITESTYVVFFPPGGSQITMSDRAHLEYTYTNSNNQVVRHHIEAKGTSEYKALWWDFALYPEETEKMRVNQSYTLTAGNKYIAFVNYQGLSMLDFSSISEQHDYFDINYIKNGISFQHLQMLSFQNSTFAGATCKVCDDGRIEIFLADSEPSTTYNVVGYITPVAKAGYKLANWTYNGQTLKAGDSFIAQEQTTMAFVANYEVDASQAPQTGDITYIYVLALIVLVAASSVGVIRYRRNH